MDIRLKELCKQKGITQKELANTLGVTEITLTRVNSGNCSLSLLERIATALNVPIQELFNPPSENKITLICPHCKGVVNVSLSVHGEQSEETNKE
jgi:transcriptional regulator with XRE-family HTH domain